MQTAITRPFAAPDSVSLASLLINSKMIALALTDQDRLLFANAAFHRLFRRGDDVALGSILDLVQPEHRRRLDGALRAEDGPPPCCVAEGLRGDSSTFEVELRFERLPVGGAPILAIFAQDVTERFRKETQLNLLAYSDPLTGLGNRALFADRLRTVALANRRTARRFAVLMLDLDGFKAVNDRHGHDAGDLVLQRIAARLLACLRDTDTVARMGGDEFAVLLPAIKRDAVAIATADRLAEMARQPVTVGASAVRVGASVGVAIYPEHACTVDGLLMAADRALYAAKRQGRGGTAMATALSAAEASPPPLVWGVAHETGAREIDEQHARLIALLNELVGALRNGEAHGPAFQEVVRYTEFHFATEERLMRAIGYEASEAHQDLHRRLLDDLRGLDVDGTNVRVSLIARYLQEWLLRHMNGPDRDLAAALLAAGAG